MVKVASEKCFNHPEREAAARCPECGRFYCRERVTEYDFRILCAKCLSRKGLGQSTRSRSVLGFAGKAVCLVLSLFFTWFTFFLLGKGLAALPNVISHEDIFLESSPWWDADTGESGDGI